MSIRRVAGVVLAGLVAGGCAHAVAGSARPNEEQAAKAMAEAYDRGMGAFEGHFAHLGDEKAKVYNYFTWGDTKRTNEFTSAKLGDPPATVLTKRRDRDGDPSVILHPASAGVDYVRLDRGHANLAPTPWVSVPTAYPRDRTFDPHFLLTSWVGVKLDECVSQTKLDAPDRQERTVSATPDGYELRTGATLATMIEQGIASVPDSLKDRVTAEMKATVLPVRMEFGPNWDFRSFEVRASVPGDPPLQLQIGYEVSGTASKDDIPPAPRAGEVTAITDQAAADKFYDQLNNSGSN